MAENKDGQEKSEEPTGKRLADAKKKGQIARSRELNTTAITIFGVGALMVFGVQFVTGLEAQFQDNFALKRSDVFDPNAMLGHLIQSAESAIGMLLPFFGVMIVVAILSSVALGGFNVSFTPMQPKFSKLNPITGMKKVFSLKGLMELMKSLGKFLLVGAATIVLLMAWKDKIVALGNMDLEPALKEAMWLIVWAALLTSSTMIIMALIDVPFQLWQHKKELKMTKQEVRDEMKQTEGRPEVKSRIRQMQREMAQARMMQEVPKADVIVTNPTHYAVALRYDPDEMNAPVVVAKGADLIAANIRDVAAVHDVPMVEAPALARAIYFNTELNDVIPAGLFLAVAQLLAYIFQLKAYRHDGGPIPNAPGDYPVPEELRHA